MRTTQSIPTDRITVSPQNVRRDLADGVQDSTLEDLAADIAAHGLLSAVIVRPAGDTFELVAGQRRLLACRDFLGWTDIDAEVRDLDDLATFLVSAAENFHRADMAPLDKAAIIARFPTDTEAARALRLSPSTCRRYRSLVSLDPALHNELGTGRGAGGVETMSMLARTFSPVDQAEVFHKIRGFDSHIVTQLLRGSGGDVDTIDDLVTEAMAGAFDRWPCGTSLATCPHAQNPDELTRMIAAHEPPVDELPTGRSPPLFVNAHQCPPPMRSGSAMTPSLLVNQRRRPSSGTSSKPCCTPSAFPVWSDASTVNHNVMTDLASSVSPSSTTWGRTASK